jgi:histidinol-phosphatase (PHP family)
MPEPFDDWRMDADQLPAYLDFVAEARASGFPVRLGLECDFIPGYESWIERLAGQVPWDYLIGSVHYIAPGWDVDNPKHLNRFTQYPVEEIWDLYWKQYVACIETGLFDFVAHPDLPKKFGYRPPGDLQRYYEPAIAALVRHKVGYEINTAGLRKGAGEVYPAYGFIELAAKANVAVIINSDAHAPSEVGYQFDLAQKLAHSAGYSRTVRFAERKRIEVDLRTIES